MLKYFIFVNIREILFSWLMTRAIYVIFVVHTNDKFNNKNFLIYNISGYKHNEVLNHIPSQNTNSQCGMDRIGKMKQYNVYVYATLICMMPILKILLTYKLTVNH